MVDRSRTLMFASLGSIYHQTAKVVSSLVVYPALVFW